MLGLSAGWIALRGRERKRSEEAAGARQRYGPARPARACLALVAMLLLTGVWAACGGAGLAPSLNSSSDATPPGTYALTLTGTYTAAPGTQPAGSPAGFSESMKLTLVVN